MNGGSAEAEGVKVGREFEPDPEPEPEPEKEPEEGEEGAEPAEGEVRWLPNACLIKIQRWFTYLKCLHPPEL